MLPKPLVVCSILGTALCARVKEALNEELSVDALDQIQSNDTFAEGYMTDELQDCPQRSACPSSHWFCPKNKGCYPGYPNDKSREKECGTAFCPPKGGQSDDDDNDHDDDDDDDDDWKPPSGGDAFAPIETGAPPAHIFQPNSGHYMPPRKISAPGRHQTNKFWTNWISGKSTDGQKPIFTMPYALKWSETDDGWKCHYYSGTQSESWCKSNPREGNYEFSFLPGGTCGHCDCCRRVRQIRAELHISHGKPKMNYAKKGDRAGRIAWYMTRFRSSFSIGIKEKSDPQHYNVKKEGLLGVHAEVKGAQGGSVTFPVYRGMAYVTGNFHGLTPRINSPQGFVKSMTKVSSGIFDFRNNEGDPNKLWSCHYYKDGESDGWCKSNPKTSRDEIKFFGPNGPCGDCHCCERPLPKPEDAGKDYGNVYRVWVLEDNGNPMSGVEFKNTSDGFVMNKPLKGWVRMAHLVNDRDAAVLDKHVSAVLEDVELYASGSSGKFGYKFKTAGNGELLHWAWIHQKMLMKGEKTYDDHQITHILAPTKGNMVPVRGSQWNLEIDLGKVQRLKIMPSKPSGSKLDTVRHELDKDLAKAAACSAQFEDRSTCPTCNGWNTRECEWPRVWLFAAGFYNNGKGLQRLGTTCLMGQNVYGRNDDRVVKCRELLKTAFECHYNPAKKCGGVPQAYYDEKWGGIASYQGFNTKMCGLADFGNACYNDHHYHYGYFIHSGALLLELIPEMKSERNFVAYINSMVRDISNPSPKDKYFPQFRAFDWYDLHSWSHGVTPSADGKDEESTSEDMNAYFGMQMWAKLNNAHSLRHTAEMQLALLAHSARNLFLISDDNKVHPKDYFKNRVTGIFFESKVHYGTFFGASSIFIHGIQMLPLTPALALARDKEFCKQEWRDVVSKIPLPMSGSHAGWGSLLITGNVAFHDPERAWGMLQGQQEFDKGMSKAWALYWVASLSR